VYREGALFVDQVDDLVPSMEDKK